MDYSEPADEGPLQEGTVISKGTVLGTMRGTGEMSRQYYKFENVHLSADGGTIAFYHGPGFQRPKEKWVSTLFNNGTAASLPTVTVVRNATTHTYRYLKIEYLSAEEAQPRCTQWVEKPVYVVQLQHNTNIWHVWTDGLMAAFQSLREQRLLPLGRVDADGRVTEVTDGLGIGCPWVLDENTGTPMQPPDGQCRPRTGLVPDRCDPERDEWCREGVVAVRRAHPDGPMLLVYSGSKIVRPWGPMFRAISRDIR